MSPRRMAFVSGGLGEAGRRSPDLAMEKTKEQETIKCRSRSKSRIVNRSLGKETVISSCLRC